MAAKGWLVDEDADSLEEKKQAGKEASAAAGVVG